MKQIILTISLLFLVCSCAGIDQHISFVEPPSNWKRVFSTKSSTLPTGEIVLGDSYSSEWQTNNNSSILMLVRKQTSISFTNPAREKTIARFESLKLANALTREEGCGFTIDNKVNGLFRNKYNFFEMESTVPCRISDSKLILKLLSIVIGSKEYMYSFLLFAHEENFVNSRKILDQLLESIVFY